MRYQDDSRCQAGAYVRDRGETDPRQMLWRVLRMEGVSTTGLRVCVEDVWGIPLADSTEMHYRERCVPAHDFVKGFVLVRAAPGAGRPTEAVAA